MIMIVTNMVMAIIIIIKLSIRLFLITSPKESKLRYWTRILLVNWLRNKTMARARGRVSPSPLLSASVTNSRRQI